MNKIAKLQKAITFLTVHGCQDFDLDLKLDYSNNPRVSTEPDRVTHEQVIALKRAWGILEPSPSYAHEHKDLVGKVDYEGITLSLSIIGALACVPYTKEELEDERTWSKIQDSALDGNITISNCKPAAYKVKDKKPELFGGKDF